MYFSWELRFTHTLQFIFVWTVRLKAAYSNTPDLEGRSGATSAALRGHHMHVFATDLPGQAHCCFPPMYTCSSAGHLHLKLTKLTSGKWLPETDEEEKTWTSSENVFIFQSCLVLDWCSCHLNHLLCTCVFFFCHFPAHLNLPDRSLNIQNLFLSFWVSSPGPHFHACVTLVVFCVTATASLHKRSPDWQQRLQPAGRMPRRQQWWYGGQIWTSNPEGAGPASDSKSLWYSWKAGINTRNTRGAGGSDSHWLISPPDETLTLNPKLV